MFSHPGAPTQAQKTSGGPNHKLKKVFFSFFFKFYILKYFSYIYIYRERERAFLLGLCHYWSNALRQGDCID
uniref:Uncharacterized protein n=1 Tax=Anguilla anguilla TaxID=7936 RepID=A0A0E9Q1T3_ANGAN